MITSVNLSAIPFQSSTDSTRLQMSSKQVQQALTHHNCDIPYVIDHNYDKLVNYSDLGIIKAREKGRVVFRNNDLLVVMYDNKDVVDYRIDSIRKTHGIFASTIRYVIEKNEFEKNDILFEYDCFTDGIPSWGYNAFTAYNVFFGFNHEDSLVISESFAQKSKCTTYEKVVIPIYEFTLLDSIYDDPGCYKYFPGVKTRIKKNVLCQSFIPKADNEFLNSKNLKNKVLNILKNMSLSDFLNLNRQTGSVDQFRKEAIKTKIKNGIISGMKIHKINDRKMIDGNLQSMLNNMLSIYGNFLMDTYNEISQRVSNAYTKYLIKRHYVFQTSPEDKRLNMNLADVLYLIEFEITDEESSFEGDKFTNRYAGKGVCSLIIPDELRPIAVNSDKPVDVLFNPYGTYSRMNFGQIVDGAIAKTVMYCDNHIRNNQDEVKETIEWLNDNIIFYLTENKSYYNEVKEQIIDRLSDSNFKNKFIEDINRKNLYIEAPGFSHIDLRQLQKNLVDPNEPILIKKDLITYIKDKLKLKNDFTVTQDLVRDNIFCVPMYTNKLYKITNHIVNARDFGPVRDITQQPLKGRSVSGGSRLGQMETEGIITHNCMRALRELMTVKSDHNQEKRNLVKQVVETGDFNMGESVEGSGRTKKVVSTIINFLKE